MVCVHSLDLICARPIVSRIRDDKRQMPEVYVVCDRDQVVRPSCSTQHEAMLLLKDLGVLFRMRSSGSGLFDLEHDRTWIFDGELGVVSSAATTANSVENDWKPSCAEADVFVKAPLDTSKMSALFAELWEDSLEVDWAYVEASWSYGGGRRNEPRRGLPGSRLR